VSGGSPSSIFLSAQGMRQGPGWGALVVRVAHAAVQDAVHVQQACLLVKLELDLAA